MSHLTPGEAIRNPRRDSAELADSSKESQDDLLDLQTWLQRIERGEENFSKNCASFDKKNAC